MTLISKTESLRSMAEDRMKILFNDDTAIIDFLADLEDRFPINAIQSGLNENKEVTACVVNYHEKEGIVTLLLCHDPFGYNEGANMLMLFVHSKFTPIIAYFERWMENTPYDEKDKRSAILAILKMLCITRDRAEYKQTQTNFMG